MILIGDAYEQLATLESESVQCIVTSPPYWGLRDYGVDGQIGLEADMNLFLASLLMVFEQCWRVLKSDGTVWVNLGDSYAGGMSRGESKFTDKQHSNKGSVFAKGRGPKVPKGLKPKDLCGIPWRFALAMQAEGWYLRQDIIWHKPNPMPESVRDRCTKAHEYIFMFAKSQRYFFDADVIKEPFVTSRQGKTRGRGITPLTAMKNDRSNSGGFNKIGSGRNKRSVWTVTPKPFKGAHFATFPPDLIEPCILAGSRISDTVLDPFFGAGTVGLVAKKHGRKYIGIELNPEYAEIAKNRIEESA